MMRRLALEEIAIILRLAGLNRRSVLHMLRGGGSVEDFRDLLQAVALRLGEEEEGDNKEDGEQAAEHDVVMPSDVFQCNRVNERQNNQ